MTPTTSNFGKTVKKLERALLVSPPQRDALIKQFSINFGIALENSSPKLKGLTFNIRKIFTGELLYLSILLAKVILLLLE